MFITYNAVKFFHPRVHHIHGGIGDEIEYEASCIYFCYDFGHFEIEEGVAAEPEVNGFASQFAG